MSDSPAYEINTSLFAYSLFYLDVFTQLLCVKSYEAFLCFQKVNTGIENPSVFPLLQ